MAALCGCPNAMQVRQRASSHGGKEPLRQQVRRGKGFRNRHRGG